jgi:hypothetical protein
VFKLVDCLLTSLLDCLLDSLLDGVLDSFFDLLNSRCLITVGLCVKDPRSFLRRVTKLPMNERYQVELVAFLVCNLAIKDNSVAQIRPKLRVV